MSLQQEIDLIHALLLHPAGYDIDIGGQLWVRRYEHPMWCVEWEVWVAATDNKPYSAPVMDKIEVMEFMNAFDAAKFFVNKRYELKLGLDQ